ncbi:MAG: TnsA endonuclease N-terminal domain-containing protein [Rhodocyclales bacterium]|nr:TnsA endonuclease N-terminal domain-containing protein [Rhodocyclales bacterium]
MPTRKITRSPVKVTGTLPDGQRYESTLEEDFYVLLRFNPLVANFETQPVTVEWRDGKGDIRRYTPDALVHYRQDLVESGDMRPVLCEIKPDLTEQSESPRRRKPPRTENEEENQLKWAAAERYAARQGWAFKVYRESEIRTPYLDNARFLLRYLEKAVDSKHEPALLAWIAERGPRSLDEWASIRGGSSQVRAEIFPACYRLIAQRRVETDLSAPLTLQSVIKALPDA